MVVSTRIGVVKANSPERLKSYRGSLELTKGWARNVIKSKRKGSPGKIEPSEQFLFEEKLTFKKLISTAIADYDIPKDLVMNLDQTPLSYASHGKYTFNPAKIVSIKGIDDNRQIPATFAVSMTGEFLPIQDIYEGKKSRCLPNCEFPSTFNVIRIIIGQIQSSPLSFFEQIILPYVNNVKKSFNYPEEQMSLVIMDTLKGQDNHGVVH